MAELVEVEESSHPGVEVHQWAAIEVPARRGLRA
jgi:hypothetical protein